jgi:HK97 family phage major capsid protein
LFNSAADFVSAIYRKDSRIDKVLEIQNAMSERVPADGGYLVPEEFRSELVEASLEDAIVRPVAQVFPMRSLKMGLPAADETTHVGSLLGGWSAAWAEEAASISDVTPGLQRDVYEAKKLMGFTSVNNELFDDAPAFGAFLRKTLPKAIAWYEDDGYFNGTGQGEPKGFLTSTCAVNVTRTNNGAALVHADIVAMLKRMWPQGWKTACWFCGPDTLGVLADTYQAVGSVTTQGMPSNPWFYFHTELRTWCLAGVPLTVTEHSPASTNVGDLSLVDCSAYVIGDRETMTVQLSPHYRFGMDQTVIRVRVRADGRMWPSSPVTPASGAATVSPVVVLN